MNVVLPITPEAQAVLGRNIAARALADSLWGVIEAEVKDAGDGVTEQRVWEVLAERLISRAGPQVVPPKFQAEMSMAEAREFGDAVVPWGVHKGKRVAEVEPSYWLAMTESPFYLRLRRWVCTPFFSMLQD